MQKAPEDTGIKNSLIMQNSLMRNARVSAVIAQKTINKTITCVSKVQFAVHM